MVISEILGGLGNQMFQYAVGRALSLKWGTLLRLEVSGFSRSKVHQGFELQQVFDCPLAIATEAEIRSILGWQYSSGIRRVLTSPRLTRFRCKGLIVEPHFNYWSGINKVRRDCYLVGYWQSEKYFLDVASVIRDDFTFKSPLVNRDAELAENIKKVNAVSLHVRRGDYAKNPTTNAMHGLCSLYYYMAAIQHMFARVEQPYFFIFSDDIAWVKDNLRIGMPCQYIDYNHGNKSSNDMRLMSMCRHHIIANSSFSWWGAWLNPNPDKIVIAPKKWFASQKYSAHDLIPSDWVRL